MKAIMTLLFAVFITLTCCTQSDYTTTGKLICIKEYVRNEVRESRDTSEWVTIDDTEICFSDGSCRALLQDNSFIAGIEVAGIWIENTTTLSLQVTEGKIFIWGSDLLNEDRGLIQIYYEIE